MSGPSADPGYAGALRYQPRLVLARGIEVSPLLANIALHVLDEHVQEQWRQHMGTEYRRTRRRRNGLGTWRLVVSLRDRPGL
jgi:hypothetical protein